MKRIIRKYSEAKPQESYGKEDVSLSLLIWTPSLLTIVFLCVQLFRRYFMKDNSGALKGAFARKLSNQRSVLPYAENDESDSHSEDELRMSKESSYRFHGNDHLQANENKFRDSAPLQGNRKRVDPVPEKDIMMMENSGPAFSNAGWGTVETTDHSLCSRPPTCAYTDGLAALGGQSSFAPYSESLVKQESNHVAQQQILRVEDMPSYVVSLPRQNKSPPICDAHFRSGSLDCYRPQDNSINTTTSTMLPIASEMLQHNQEKQRLASSMFANGIHSRSASCPVYLVNNNETRKFLDTYEASRTCPPQLLPLASDPTSAGILPHVELSTGLRQDQTVPGSFFACPRGEEQALYPYMNEQQIREAHLPRVSQEDLLLHQIFQNTPPYKYPHSSNTNTNQS
eukprot:g8238.t1